MDTLSRIPRPMVNQRDKQGRTVLFWASRRGDHLNVERLLHCGADPNVADATGMTSLHWACRAADVTCMQLLLQAKADVHATAHGVWSPLQSASNFSNSDSLKLLLKYGADIESTNRSGWTPLQIAAERDHTENLLYLIQSGGDINARNLQGNTVLLVSVLNNSHKVIPHLLENEMLDINAVNNANMDVINMAACFGDLETLEILYNATGGDSRVAQRYKGGDISSLRSAAWRKDCNDSWARTSKKLPDKDPIAWFAAFKRLHDSISSRQQEIVNGPYNE